MAGGGGEAGRTFCGVSGMCYYELPAVNARLLFVVVFPGRTKISLAV